MLEEDFSLSFSILPTSLARDAFGVANGAENLLMLIIRPRIVQGAFKVLITDAYQRRCAITGEKTFDYG